MSVKSQQEISWILIRSSGPKPVNLLPTNLSQTSQFMIHTHYKPVNLLFTHVKNQSIIIHIHITNQSIYHPHITNQSIYHPHISQTNQFIIPTHKCCRPANLSFTNQSHYYIYTLFTHQSIYCLHIFVTKESV